MLQTPIHPFTKRYVGSSYTCIKRINSPYLKKIDLLPTLIFVPVPVPENQFFCD